MINIRDLHFNKEILPLFDFTLNGVTQNTLAGLFSFIPATEEEILLRQGILKGFLKNKRLLDLFSYYKTEFNEVYQLFDEIKNKRDSIHDSERLQLIFFRIQRQAATGKLNQLVFFFYKIYSFYFERLDTAVFPEPFAKSIEQLSSFIQGLDINAYREIARTRGLKINHIIRLTELIFQKIKTGEADLFWKNFFLFEAWLSVAKGISKHNFTFPIFSDHSFLMEDFYHPLLKVPVKNSIQIETEVILLTGPNMCGKSTLLKALCLCVYLGHLGLAVPASICVMPFFNSISVAINLNDDMENGYSHFMTEIKTLKGIVTEAKDSKRCFAVFDELFRGTNIEDALAISKTTITGLARFKGSCFIISTHLHQLKEHLCLNDHKTGSYYIECNLDGEKPVFTYRLKKGWSDLKIGQLIFEQAGLKELLGS